MAVHVLDDYYLAITFLITVAYQLVGFSIAWTFKFDKITDFMGGTNFVWLAIITLSFSGTMTARNIVTSIFMMLWGARLSGFLLFRILKTGKDDRFDDKRDKFFSFLGFWVFQMIWVWSVSLPVTILNSPAVLAYAQPAFGTANDIIACIFFPLFAGLELVADVQKYRFKQTPAGKEPGAFCNVGFWKYSRHPNYFGEILTHVSIFIMAVTPASYNYVPYGSGPYNALMASMLGFWFLTVLLFFVSGLTLQERPSAKKKYEKGQKWPEYQQYLHDTSIWWMMPPAIWRNLPVIVKRTIGLEWPLYVFDPAKHADQDKVQERQSEEGLRNGEQESSN